MSIFSPTGGGRAPTVIVSSPTIQNTVLTAANTEYTIVIPAGTARFTLKSRQDAILKIAYTSTETATNYWTVGYGVCYTERELDSSGITLYIQSSKALTDIEVISWA